jgi:hypothetical protein
MIDGSAAARRRTIAATTSTAMSSRARRTSSAAPNHTITWGTWRSAAPVGSWQLYLHGFGTGVGAPPAKDAAEFAPLSTSARPTTSAVVRVIAMSKASSRTTPGMQPRQASNLSRHGPHQ